MSTNNQPGPVKVQTSLESAFAARKESFVHRSSAIFPIRLRRDTDLLIVFLNYWKLKSKIDSVRCTLRIYSSDGTLVTRHSTTDLKSHNEFSLRQLYGDGDLDGMVEVEVLSLENLRFPFPAVMGFYRSGDTFSCVHSAGRIRNSDEPGVVRYSEETNWSCKFGEDVVPFFHIFNGPRSNGVGSLVVRLISPENREIACREFDPGLAKPFSSRVVALDEIFDLSGAPPDSFVSVRVPEAEFFPRLVVGNLHRKLELLETTHSFPITTISDYIRPPDGGGKLLSFLPTLQAPELIVDLVSFPTNAPAKVSGVVRRAPEGETLRSTGEKLSWQTGGEGAGLFIFRPKAEDALVSIDFSEGQVPSRLNSSYRYQVRGGKRVFSTDIATGAKSWVYPPKYTHWGHGILSNDYDTIVMLRNVGHSTDGGHPNSGLFTLYLNDGTVLTQEVSLLPESCRFIYLRELASPSQWESPRLVSWFLTMASPDVETFWVAYTSDGRICGEHGF